MLAARFPLALGQLTTSVRRTCALLACAIVTLLTGGTSMGKELADTGSPPRYADGLDEDCHGGRKVGGSLFDRFRTYTSRFERNSQYAQGWSDGFPQYEAEQEAAMRQACMAIEQRRLAEQRQRDKDARQRELDREVLKGVDVESLKSLK